MVEPITATYVQEDDDWTITVNGLGKNLTARAPGIIAARDTTDQLVEKIAPDGRSTVVHLLNGSALDFTAAYMTARLTRSEEYSAPLEVPPPGSSKKDPGKATAKPTAKPPLPQGKQLSKAVEASAPQTKKTDNAKKAAEPGSTANPLVKAATPPALT